MKLAWIFIIIIAIKTHKLKVSKAISKKGTTLIAVNSVCGCAAANARPGIRNSLLNGT